MFIPLTFIADPTGGWVALGFILVFVVKAVLAAIGGDADTDIDSDTDIDINSDGFGLSASDFFSLKGFINFGVGFASYWALFGLTPWYNALIAVVLGFITLFALMWVYRSCMKLDGNVVLENPDDLTNRTGTIYAKTGGCLVVQINYNNRIDEIVVSPDTDYTMDDFKSGDTVYISRVEHEGDRVKFFAKPYNN